MKKIIKWFDTYSFFVMSIFTLLIGIYCIFLNIYNVKLVDEKTELKEKIAKVEQERDDNWDLVLERNNEIYLLKMERDEWKELFYAEIDFQPYEGYPHMDDFSTSCK